MEWMIPVTDNHPLRSKHAEQEFVLFSTQATTACMKSAYSKQNGNTSFLPNFSKRNPLKSVSITGAELSSIPSNFIYMLFNFPLNLNKSRNEIISARSFMKDSTKEKRGDSGYRVLLPVNLT
jgi:hypothetical protein